MVGLLALHIFILSNHDLTQHNCCSDPCLNYYHIFHPPLITWATVTESPPPPLRTVPPSKWLKLTLIPLSDSILTKAIVIVHTYMEDIWLILSCITDSDAQDQKQYGETRSLGALTFGR